MFQLNTGINFNSHAHVERDDTDVETFEKQYNFNSHAHVERDDLKAMLNTLVQISTHTLTWSVTNPLRGLLFIFSISTHTLTWSVTLDVVYIWCLLNVMRTYFFI